MAERRLRAQLANEGLVGRSVYVCAHVKFSFRRRGASAGPPSRAASTQGRSSPGRSGRAAARVPAWSPTESSPPLSSPLTWRRRWPRRWPWPREWRWRRPRPWPAPGWHPHRSGWPRDRSRSLLVDVEIEIEPGSWRTAGRRPRRWSRRRGARARSSPSRDPLGRSHALGSTDKGCARSRPPRRPSRRPCSWLEVE